VASPSGAQALLQGGQNAALTMQQANAYDPWAAVLQGAGSNPYIQQGARSLFGGGGSPNAPIEERSYSASMGGGGGSGTWSGAGGYGSVYY